MRRKPDWPPLLAPGRHYLLLAELKALCVDRFDGEQFRRRQRLFHSLEEMVQALLVAKVRCQLRVDGSFLTTKPDPEDIDVIVAIDHDVSQALNEEQRQLIDNINSTECFLSIDSTAWVNYVLGDESFGSRLDADSASETFGVENGEVYLKGYAVLRLWETNVGLRICR